MKCSRFSWIAILVVSLCLNLARGDESSPPERLHTFGGADTHEELDATAWVATSGEHVACCHQTFNLAAESLDLALRDKTWTASTEQFETGGYQDLPPAIIVTLDEGVWSIWPFQSRIMFETGQFDYNLYVKWRNSMRDPALPGAEQFLRRATDKGVAIIYACPCGESLRDPIVRAIKRLSFPWGQRDQLLLGGPWPSPHKREQVAKSHRILLIVSDYLGEFMPSTDGPPEPRIEKAAQHPEMWGLKWFINPNPMYGHWEQAYDLGKRDQPLRIKNMLAALEPGIDIEHKLDHPHERLNTTIWMATSGEYYACAKEVFNSATAKLDLALRDKMWTASLEQFKSGKYSDLPPAIMVNLDDAVWNNDPYEARLILQDTQYDYESFSRWVNEAKCSPIPGAKEFLQHARDLGCAIVYISPRGDDLRDATLRNLARVQFPYDPSKDELLLDGNWGDHDKREQVARKFRILLIVSESLGDFVHGAQTTPAVRRELAARYADYWGLKWFIMPNPVYGIWEYSLYNFDFELDRPSRIQIKLHAVDPKAVE